MKLEGTDSFAWGQLVLFRQLLGLLGSVSLSRPGKDLQYEVSSLARHLKNVAQRSSENNFPVPLFWDSSASTSQEGQDPSNRVTALYPFSESEKLLGSWVSRTG